MGEVRLVIRLNTEHQHTNSHTHTNSFTYTLTPLKQHKTQSKARINIDQVYSAKSASNIWVLIQQMAILHRSITTPTQDNNKRTTLYQE